MSRNFLHGVITGQPPLGSGSKAVSLDQLWAEGREFQSFSRLDILQSARKRLGSLRKVIRREEEKAREDEARLRKNGKASDKFAGV